MTAHPILLQSRRLLCTLALASLLLLSVVQPALAAPARQGKPPQPPARFFGTVTLDGRPVPAGTEVRALINGTVYAVTQTTAADDAALYILDVPADDPATPDVVEGGQTGDVVAFEVDGVAALETGAWRPEEATELNLTALTPTATPTIPVTPTRTPRPTPRPPVTIPEPGTLALFASGLAGLFAMAAGVATRRR